MNYKTYKALGRLLDRMEDSNLSNDLINDLYMVRGWMDEEEKDYVPGGSEYED